MASLTSGKIRIRLKAYDHDAIDRAAQEIVGTAERTGATVAGPSRCPTEKHVYCVIRSPFKDKDSREHFEIRTHKRLIDIHQPTPKTVDELQRMETLPAGVDVEIRPVSAIVGKKLGMTRVFDEDGTAIPVTVIEAAPEQGHRDPQGRARRLRRHPARRRAGHRGAQADEGRARPPEEGERRRRCAPWSSSATWRSAAGGGERMRPRARRNAQGCGCARDAGDEKSSDEGTGGEDASSDGEAGDVKVGDEVTVTAFEPGEHVKVSAVSIGKGFQGTIKRHNFSRGPVTHGSHNVRAPGSVGASADPARVFQGRGCPAGWAAAASPSSAPTIVEVDAERNLLLIRGSVPGGRNATVEVRSAG